ncbi:MAG: hypothetical protein ACRC8A_04135 [Microcoleaceae cyanobacterium]
MISHPVVEQIIHMKMMNYLVIDPDKHVCIKGAIAQNAISTMLKYSSQTTKL